MKMFKTKAGTDLPLMNIKGKDYLQVCHRLVWFREEHPDWSIVTEYIAHGNDFSWAKATIIDDANRIVATGHKYEDKQGFPDFREKSETSAIGRALALCGYGTQFCEEELDEGKRLADSPIGNQPAVFPDQPLPVDGVFVDRGYRIPFGKFARRSLEEIDLNELRSYIIYLESSAEKKGTLITGVVLDFIQRATEHISSFENSSKDESNDIFKK
jgi:hypothetical protein